MKDKTTRRKAKIPFDVLDSIRGIAALYVTVAHCRGVLWMGGGAYMTKYPRDTWDIYSYFIIFISMLTRLATEFVVIFFVLSGFCIAHSLINTRKIGRFYARRFVRIYPPYVAAIGWAAIVFIITSWLFPQWFSGELSDYAFLRTVEMPGFFEPSVLLSNLLYAPSRGFIAPFWSLTYEVIFYITVPVAIYLGLRGYCLISALVLLIGWVSASSSNSYLAQHAFHYNAYFCVGILGYQYLSPLRQLLNKSSDVLCWLLAFGILGAIYATNILNSGSSVFSTTFAALLSLFLIVFFINSNVRIRPLMYVGKFSYSLYITHFASIYLYLALYWMFSGTRSSEIEPFYVWLPAIPLCLFLAVIFYWLVESRCNRVVKKLRST